MPISKGSSCKEILEQVIEILNFNVTKPMWEPIIEYASSAWDTNNKNVIQKVESVQRKAARFILNDYDRDSSVSKMLVFVRFLRTQNLWTVVSHGLCLQNKVCILNILLNYPWVYITNVQTKIKLKS